MGTILLKFIMGCIIQGTIFTIITYHYEKNKKLPK